MKTQRRRNRAGVARTPERAQDNIGSNGTDDSDGSNVSNESEQVVDGELSDVQQSGNLDGENGVESHLEPNGADAVGPIASDDNEVVAPGNGTSSAADPAESVNGNSSGTGTGTGNGKGNGQETVTAGTRTVVRNLPRRRPRIEPSIEEEAPVVVAAPVTSARPGKRGALPIPPPPAPRPRPQLPPQESVALKAFRLIVTYESLIYLFIFGLAIVTRFWDVGNRGIHHDESLHSVYSRNLYIGTGYTHDPMMHGPLQFNFIALMFWLFGTSDTTTRFASVLCGIFVVMSPFFLRKQMGRWPALIASFLFLVSPTILYFSRMAREDAQFSGMEMIMIVGLWRFVSTRRPADFFIFMAGLSLMFTIKETAYLTTAVLIIFFGLMFALQAGYAILGALGGYGAVMGAFYIFVSGKMKSGEIGKLPDIPATNPDYGTITTFMGQLFGHPLVEGAIAITVVFVAVLALLFVTQRRRLRMADEMAAAPVIRRRPVRASNGTQSLPNRRVRPGSTVTVADEGRPTTVVSAKEYDEEEAVAPSNGQWVEEDGYVERLDATEVWDPKRLDPKPGSFLGRYQPGSIPYLLGSLFSRPSVILIGFLIAATIFIVLYSVFFTDVPRGILSGMFASLGYWMAQQGVERGGQPWFYYMLIVPLYEPIAVFFSFVATIFFSVKGIRGLLRRRDERYYSGEPGLGLFNVDRPVPFAKFSSLLPAFMLAWLGGVFVLYSWAGEKMPWLTMHIARPAILLASLFLGALVASIIARRYERLEWAADNGYSYGNAYGYGATVPLAETPAVPQRRVQEQAVVPQKRRPGESALPPPPRRKVAPRFVPREQVPPWIAWNEPGSKFPALSFLTLFVLLAFAWGLKMNALTAKSDFGNWWQSWLYPVLILIVAVSYSVWLGPSRVLRYFAVGIFSMLFVYQFKSATALAYQHPDVPIELAVYVQTSPDVTRSVKELNDYSAYATGGTDLKVVYDSFASWPYEWYLRDYKNKQFIGDGTFSPGPNTPVAFLEYAKHNNDATLNDYVVQRYAMRWWFPEETYKNDFMPGLDPKSSPVMSQVGAALNTTVSSVTDPGRMSSLWSYLVFRKLPKPLGSEDMVLVLRKDIAQVWHYLQYDPPKINDVQPVVRDPNAK